MPCESRHIGIGKYSRSQHNHRDHFATFPPPRTAVMRLEIKSAGDFLSNLLRVSGNLDTTQLEDFNRTLQKSLCNHYQNHWFPEKPFKGSAYRCLRINHKMDPIILRSAKSCGLSENQVFTFLPNELTIWIDPSEVSYRIGEDGSVGILYEKENTPVVISNSNSSSQESLSSDGHGDLYSSCQESYRFLAMPGTSPESVANRNFPPLAAFVSS